MFSSFFWLNYSHGNYEEIRWCSELGEGVCACGTFGKKIDHVVKI